MDLSHFKISCNIKINPDSSYCCANMIIHDIQTWFYYETIIFRSLSNWEQSYNNFDL